MRASTSAARLLSGSDLSRAAACDGPSSMITLAAACVPVTFRIRAASGAGMASSRAAAVFGRRSPKARPAASASSIRKIVAAVAGSMAAIPCSRAPRSLSGQSATMRAAAVMSIDTSMEAPLPVSPRAISFPRLASALAETGPLREARSGAAGSLRAGSAGRRDALD